MSDHEIFSHYSRLQLSRAAVGIVLFLNIQCAVQFLASPADYAAGFELSGTPGETAIRAMGILFLMWNVPYAFALIHPVRHRLSYFQAVIMQLIGLLGEILLGFSIPAGHDSITTSIWRFIIFDGTGLAFLIFGLFLINRRFPKNLIQE